MAIVQPMFGITAAVILISGVADRICGKINPLDFESSSNFILKGRALSGLHLQA
jgi:hypothetical protein